MAAFLLSYPLLLVLWIQLNPSYGFMVTEIGARSAAAVMDVNLEEVRRAGEFTRVTFAWPVLVHNSIQEMLIDLKVSTSVYSFNVPLTAALVLALLPCIRWRPRALIEILVLVVAVHVLYVFSYCALQVLQQLVTQGIRAGSRSIQFVWEFLWQFTDNMIIRFEPFLVAVYLWLRRSPEAFVEEKRTAQSA